MNENTHNRDHEASFVSGSDVRQLCRLLLGRLGGGRREGGGAAKGGGAGKEERTGQTPEEEEGAHSFGGQPVSRQRPQEEVTPTQIR